MAKRRPDKMSAPDLLEQLTFYGAYHSNKWNQLIHFFFVPSIVWATGVWLAGIIPGLALSLPFYGPSYINLPFLAILGLAYNFVRMDPVAGVSWTVCVGVPTWLTSTAFAADVEGAWRWALLVQVVSWYMQVHPGHTLLEKRKPALMDSMAQAFATAPLFVWLELLFLLGYRPQLHRELKNRVGKEIQAWKRQQAKQHSQ